MSYQDWVKHFSYEELVEAYASLCKLEEIIPIISTQKDSSLDLNFCSLDIVERTFHVYFAFNSTSYTGNTRELILDKIAKIKIELQNAIKESSKNSIN